MAAGGAFRMRTSKTSEGFISVRGEKGQGTFASGYREKALGEAGFFGEFERLRAGK